MKRIIVVISILIVALTSVSIVGAQEENRRGEFFDVILEATGLTEEELHEALSEDGATLASVIEANGGDVDAVIAQLSGNIIENNPDADAHEITERLNDRFNSTSEDRPQLGDGDGNGRPPRGDGDGGGRPPRGDGNGRPPRDGGNGGQPQV